MRQFLELNPQAVFSIEWQMIARIDPMHYPTPPDAQCWAKRLRAKHKEDCPFSGLKKLNPLRMLEQPSVVRAAYSSSRHGEFTLTPSNPFLACFRRRTVDHFILLRPAI